jgi:hypothetical protein
MFCDSGAWNAWHVLLLHLMLGSINVVAAGYVWLYNKCGTPWLINSALLPAGFFDSKHDIEVAVVIILLLRSALFWDVAQRTVVIPYRRFGTTYRSHLQGPRNPRFLGPWRWDRYSVKLAGLFGFLWPWMKDNRKRIVKKSIVRTGFCVVWLRIGTGGGLSWTLLLVACSKEVD